MTGPANRMWWIVLNPAGAELNGVLIDHEGNRVAVLMGPAEDGLVRQLAADADPTVDVSVAHGWAQAPADLKALYDAKRASGPRVLRRIEE
jgi:hypothetical protein